MTVRSCRAQNTIKTQHGESITGRYSNSNALLFLGEREREQELRDPVLQGLAAGYPVQVRRGLHRGHIPRYVHLHPNRLTAP